MDLGVFGDVLLMCGRPKTRMHESPSGRPETRMHKPQDDLGVCSGPRSCERPLTTFTVFEPEDLHNQRAEITPPRVSSRWVEKWSPRPFAYPSVSAWAGCPALRVGRYSGCVRR